MHPTIALNEFEDEWPWPTFLDLNAKTCLCDNFIFHAPIYTQFEPWMSFNMNDLDLHFTYCSKSQWMEIMPVPTCCKLHAHNYTCIPIILGRRTLVDPTGQFVLICYVTQYTLLIMLFLGFTKRPGDINDWWLYHWIIGYLCAIGSIIALYLRALYWDWLYLMLCHFHLDWTYVFIYTVSAWVNAQGV